MCAHPRTKARGLLSAGSPTAGLLPGLFIPGLFGGERWPDLSGGLVWSLCVVFIAWSGSCQSSLYWYSLKS